MIFAHDDDPPAVHDAVAEYDSHDRTISVLRKRQVELEQVATDARREAHGLNDGASIAEAAKAALPAILVRAGQAARDGDRAFSESVPGTRLNVVTSDFFRALDVVWLAVETPDAYDARGGALWAPWVHENEGWLLNLVNEVAPGAWVGGGNGHLVVATKVRQTA